MAEFAYSDASAEAVLRKASQSAGFNRWSGFELVAAGNGQVCLSLAIREDMTQHHGFAHGGIVGALSDTACSWAAATVAGDVVTASYTVQFHAPATGIRLIAEACVIKKGRRNVSVEARVYSADDAGQRKHVATTLALIAVVAAVGD
jgi:uncharacterized protein (TIGR00369 family)